MSEPALIDSHCHLNYDYAPKTAADLIREANEIGVTHLITVGTEVASISAVVQISEAHPCVFHSVGVHPHDAAQMSDDDLKTIEKSASHPKCRAVGEIGLDYHYDHSPRDIQIRRVNEQLELAIFVKQPVIIHSRDAEPDLLKCLQSYSKKIPAGHPAGVIHCFTGTEPFAKACIEMDFYISFSGILTFKTAEDLREIAKKLPLNRLLVETDSPYLAPIPMRGKKCEPSMVRFTAQKLAEIRGVPFPDLAKATTENSKTLFRLK